MGRRLPGTMRGIGLPLARSAVRALAAAAALWAASLAAAQTPQPMAPPPPDAIPQAPRLRALDLAPFREAIAALPPGRAAEIRALIDASDLPALQEAMWEGRLTSEELTTYYLSRIARHDEGLRSFLEINPAALEEARAADAAFRDGQVRGPLHGIPVSLKDNIETAGPMHTTANAAVLLDNVASADAALVAQLRAQGAVILGKNSLSEFAGVVSRGAPSGGSGAVGGQGMNPHGPFDTAGSSSGGGIAVAAFLTHLAVGSETSGSLIAPGTANGIVAMKPTKGLVPGAGVIPLLLNNDTAGPMGRSVAEVATLLGVIDTADVDYTSGFSLSALDGVTAGVLADGVAGSAYAEALPRAIIALTGAGARLRPAELTDPTGEVGALTVLLGGGIRHDMMPYVTARRPDLATPDDLAAWNAADPAGRAPFGQDLLLALNQIGAQLSAEDFAQGAAAITAAATAAMERAFAASGAEVLVSSSSVHAPFYATAGYPAVTVPLGLGSAGQPVGVTLIGKRGEDARLLSFAHA
ncbi:MAG: amidase family protein, partial [Rhodobacteraceae bacterium]|nr:amidase family protein [Paracoccaceae bacterium]